MNQGDSKSNPLSIWAIIVFILIVGCTLIFTKSRERVVQINIESRERVEQIERESRERVEQIKRESRERIAAQDLELKRQQFQLEKERFELQKQRDLEASNQAPD